MPPPSHSTEPGFVRAAADRVVALAHASGEQLSDRARASLERDAAEMYASIARGPRAGEADAMMLRWVDAWSELLTRLGRDRPTLGRTFGRTAGRIAALAPRLGDPHDGFRRVTGIALAGGLRLVYKPRPMAADAAWTAVVRWAREAGLHLFAAPVLDRGSYGWARWTPAAARGAGPLPAGPAGELLALLDVLAVVDAHRHNVVAARGRITLLDAETLAHPPLPGLDAVPSLLLSGLIPLPHQLDEPSRPALAGPRRDVVAGYRRGYAALERHGAALLASGGPMARVAGSPVRIVLRDTRVYERARSAPNRRSLNAALRSGALPPFPAATRWRIERAERADLWSGDVPRFHSIAGSRDLLWRASLLVSGCFVESGLGRVANRMGALGPADRARSVDLLESCLRLDRTARRQDQAVAGAARRDGRRYSSAR